MSRDSAVSGGTGALVPHSEQGFKLPAEILGVSSVAEHLGQGNRTAFLSCPQWAQMEKTSKAAGLKQWGQSSCDCASQRSRMVRSKSACSVERVRLRSSAMAAEGAPGR